MKNYRLNITTQEAIKKNVGLDIDEISLMDTDLLDERIEKKIRKKLEHQTKLNNLTSRGSVYIELGRLMPMDDIDKMLTKI